MVLDSGLCDVSNVGRTDTLPASTHLGVNRNMTDLIELLRLFNKRERYFLIDYALGGFTLGDRFRRALEVELKLDIPAEAFVAMDYDLEWLAASLLASKHPDGATNFSRIYEGVPSTYPDVDLLIAFRSGEEYHLILIEAKGYTGWLNNQMKVKAEYLAAVFGEKGDNHPGVVPHFCLIAPKEPPERLTTGEWPQWMTLADGRSQWVEIPLPEERLVVTRKGTGRQGLPGGSIRIRP